jgi:hypothetical protein
VSIPTKGEKYAELIEHLRKGQEAAAMLAHLHADESHDIRKGMINISEMLRLIGIQATYLIALGKPQWN